MLPGLMSGGATTAGSLCWATAAGAASTNPRTVTARICFMAIIGSGLLVDRQPPLHGGGHELRSILLDEMAGAWNGDERQIFFQPVPRARQRFGVQRSVVQSVEHEHRHLHLRQRQRQRRV